MCSSIRLIFFVIIIGATVLNIEGEQSQHYTDGDGSPFAEILKLSLNGKNEPREKSRTHNNSEGTSRHKRFLSMASRQPNKSYQQCVTPSGGKGHCKHIQHCVLADFKQNFWKFLDYLCIIERSAVGVCCPDDMTEKAGSGFNVNLPAAGDEPPIWGSEDDLEASNAEGIVNRQEDRGCGLATKQFPKITGGRPADPGEWPWMAALLTRGPDKAFCGGVLITDRHVLTAAHCTRKFRANELFIRLGEYNFKTYEETRARDFKAAEIREHIDYDPTTYENDIAVIKMHRPSLFNSYIWPVCMPPLGESWEGYMGIVTGWGTQFFGGPHSDVLMEVTVPVWSQRRCQTSFTSRINENVLCAGAYEGGRDSCQGDSGGPLLVQLPNERWVVAGIVSWGVRCGEAQHPGIYTRVSSYINWIIENSVF